MHGRHLRKVREKLLAQLGTKPTFTQSEIIERAAWISLKIALLDLKQLEGVITEIDVKTYVALTNMYARMLHQLGMRVNAEAIAEEFNLADYIAAKSEVAAEK